MMGRRSTGLAGIHISAASSAASVTGFATGGWGSLSGLRLCLDTSTSRGQQVEAKVGDGVRKQSLQEEITRTRKQLRWLCHSFCGGLKPGLQTTGLAALLSSFAPSD